MTRNPYYSRGGITILHGDAIELLPAIKADACVSDPPYGINYKSGHNSGYVRHPKEWDKWGRDQNFPPIAGDDKPFDPSPCLRFRQLALCGGNYFASRLPNSKCWITWDKREDSGSDRQSDCEYVWTNFDKPARIFRHLWRGLCRRGEENVSKAVKYHPNQKPVALMRFVIEYGDVGPLIVDPFMGSGSTLLAAMDCGRHCIGIECEERYCEIAANRLENRTPPLFVA